MRIRRFQDKDAISVTRLHRRTIRELNSKDYNAEQISRWSGQITAKKCREWIQNKYVAVEKGRVVGFGDFMGDELTGLYVHPDYIGKGVGSMLYDCLEEKMRVKRIKCTSTLTARGFYLKKDLGS